MPKLNQTTKLLMCAVHLYPNDFRQQLEDRLTHPCKSPAPEFGISLRQINDELEKSKRRHFFKSVIIFVIIYCLYAQSLGIEANLTSLIIYAWIMASIVEFIYARLVSKSLDEIMNDEVGVSASDEIQIRDHNENVSIFGGFWPFIGAGLEANSWSFTVDLNDPKDEDQPTDDITIPEIHSYIEERLKSLQLDEMTIEDELFVTGSDVNLIDHYLMGERICVPHNYVNKEYMNSKVGSDDKKERHYKVVRIPMWGGQVFVSMYYRFLIRSQNLFLEARFFILPPIRKKFRDIENISIPLKKQRMRRRIGKALVQGAVSWISVLYHLAIFIGHGFFEKLFKRGDQEKEVLDSRLYDYGWEKSLRELWSENKYERYFQKVDVDVTLKLLTGTFLSTLKEYLAQHNVSTAQFGEASTRIINEGILVTGGELKAESLSVGKGAKIINTFMQRVEQSSGVQS